MTLARVNEVRKQRARPFAIRPRALPRFRPCLRPFLFPLLLHYFKLSISLSAWRCSDMVYEKRPVFSGQPWMAASKLRSPEKMDEQERAWKRATGVFE
ncbi:MAG: hypothetical protein JO113_08905 [Candidatus Eremiobacteraeota bacterium]|nr:hypothetical protein [Candidatus Eremiobacteraeota bacterium]